MCRFVHAEWGRCQQQAEGRRWYCSFHQHWLHIAGEPDSYYHEKIVKGLAQPALTYLTPTEIHNLIGGKYHGDGRRLDRFVVEEV
jgi:hypothetical protein